MCPVFRSCSKFYQPKESGPEPMCKAPVQIHCQGGYWQDYGGQRIHWFAGIGITASWFDQGDLQVRPSSQQSFPRPVLAYLVHLWQGKQAKQRAILPSKLVGFDLYASMKLQSMGSPFCRIDLETSRWTGWPNGLRTGGLCAPIRPEASDRALLGSSA